MAETFRESTLTSLCLHTPHRIMGGPLSTLRAYRCAFASRLAGVFFALALLLLPAFAHAQDADRRVAPARTRRAATLTGQSVTPAATATVNFGQLARAEALRLTQTEMPPVRVRDNDEGRNEEMEEGFEPEGNVIAPRTSLQSILAQSIRPFAASPAPAQNFIGLDDIPMADSSYIVIPPDVSGAVGLTKVMQGSNNNYRILDKTTGAVLATLGTATFWGSVVAVSERASLTDPRMAYDPYNNRWIAAMQTFTSGAGKILVGVSQTSDPQGAWFLYSFNTAGTVDYPILGFNKNWISVSINKYNAAGSAFANGINLIMNYPLARTGTGSGTIVSLAANTGFCVAPALTYSTTTDTLYAVAHMSSAGGTYALDFITGTAAAPVYHQGGAIARTGGGWAQPSGNALPQSNPVAGVAACAPACKLEVQDSYVRSAPVFRGGFIYYAQTVGLPAAGLTHTAAQWTKITTPSGAFVDGGRLEDPTATATNGGKWYSTVHITANGAGDFMLAFSQFSSAQHPSAGYAVHLGADAAGSIRDAQIYKAGDDYYHKTFSTATGRNRWGDFSTAQVDPSDDTNMWALQEYAKARATTDDGNTGSNASKWGTWWARVAPSVSTFTINASAGANGSISPSGAVVVNSGANQSFTITPAANYHIVDVQVDGGSVGAVPSYTFTNVLANHTIAATFAIDQYSIIASAGANGSIAPAGNTVVNAGGAQAYTITPAANYHVADVLVDGISVGAVSTYNFTNVLASHTIAASFAINTFTITASAGANGSITPSGAVGVNATAAQGFTITPNANYHVLDVLVDGVSVGAVTTYNFTNVLANHTIAASFAINTFTITASAGANGSITPSGAVGVNATAAQGFTITPNANYHVLDVLVDGVSVGAVTTYNFTNVLANHTIAASFAINTFTITASAGANGSISPTGSVGVSAGANQGFTITPSANYHVLDVLVDGVSVGAVTTYNFTNVLANHTIAASFAINTFTITASAGANGSISPNGGTPVNAGGAQGYTITPNANYHVLDVLVDGVSVGAVTTYNFTNVLANHTIAASFAIDTYSITASANTGGTITPSGVVNVNAGGSQSFAIAPSTGYHVFDVIVDGSSVGVVANYGFTNVLANHTIVARFAINSYTLNVSIVGSGSVTKSPDQPTYDHGTAVTLTATPATGFAFSSWTGDAEVSTNPLPIVMNGNASYTATFADTAGPAVAVTAPNGGEILNIGAHANLAWSATDNLAVTAVDLFLSRAGAAGPYDSIATNQPNSGTYDWIVTGPATSSAVLKVVAHDAASNTGSDLSDAVFQLVSSLGVEDGPVLAFGLSSVVPNPSRGIAHVTFALPRAARVHVGVLDVQGREVLTLADGEFGAGRHQAQLSTGRGLSPGLYFVRMSVPGQTFVKRFAVMN
jgi:ABC-type transporter MlaC component